jgi:hypothetical protein
MTKDITCISPIDGPVIAARPALTAPKSNQLKKVTP